MCIMVAAAQHCEVRHLEGVWGPAASLQGACHRVAHVEISLGHVRCQIQLLKVKKGLSIVTIIIIFDMPLYQGFLKYDPPTP